MGIWKAIFGGKDLTAEEEQQERVEKNFDLLKYDGVKAMKMGQARRRRMALHGTSLRQRFRWRMPARCWNCVCQGA